jgi:hypothetical protein
VKIIKEISPGLFVVELKNKQFEGYRLATQEDLISGKTLRFYTEEHYEELFGRGK